MTGHQLTGMARWVLHVADLHEGLLDVCQLRPARRPERVQLGVNAGQQLVRVFSLHDIAHLP